MSAIAQIRERAKTKKRTVVFPEGAEPRTIAATRKILSEGIASVILLGDEKEITKVAAESNLSLSRVQVINPSHSPDYNRFVQEYLQIRKAKGTSEAEASAALLSPLYFGAMLVRLGMADASVAGAVSTTSDVIRAAIQVIGLKPGTITVSSSFLMTIPKFAEQHNKAFLFADCAVMPNPNAEQLAAIAYSTAETMRLLIGEDPRVAMLSFSTHGSAKHADVDKVRSALAIVRHDHPDLKIDGELQLDAAIIPEIAKRKAADSMIAGDANVLIFPDLDAGNIGYKLVERFAGATATGPIIQGLAQPANDLSRGCSVDDIVDTAAIAVMMKGV